MVNNQFLFLKSSIDRDEHFCASSLGWDEVQDERDSELLGQG